MPDVLQLKPFEADDILMIQAREPDRTIAEGIPDLLEAARLYEKMGMGFTGIVNGAAIGAAGLVVIWPGVASGWAFTSALVRKYQFSFHRAVRKHLGMIAHELKLHRVQVEIPVTHRVSRCWVSTLGFRREGVMRQYGTDRSDYVRYVRFFGENTCPSFQS
jgi:hypothetical protein